MADEPAPADEEPTAAAEPAAAAAEAVAEPAAEAGPAAEGGKSASKSPAKARPASLAHGPGGRTHAPGPQPFVVGGALLFCDAVAAPQRARHSAHARSCVIAPPLCNRTLVCTLQPNHAQERNPPPAEAPAVPAKPPPEPKPPLPRASIVEACPPSGTASVWLVRLLRPHLAAPGSSARRCQNESGAHNCRPSPNAARTQAAATLWPKPRSADAGARA